MKVLILAPNAGASLSTGGGVNFVLKQAQALERLGHDVTIAGFHSLSREALSRIHTVTIPSTVRIFDGASSAAYETFRAVPVKLSAYDALLDPRFPRWIEQVFEKTKPEVVWFHDDVPRAAARYRRNCRFYLYVHFPLLGRDTRICPPLDRTALERLNDFVLRAASTLFIVDNPFDSCDGVWTNSTVTTDVIRRIWGHDGVYLPTYVADVDVNMLEYKENNVVAVGSFSQGKNYTDLIEGFAAARIADWKLQIAGHERDHRYVQELRNRIRHLGLENSVELLISPTGERLRSMIRRASLVVHAARFEPFGLALLEAMSAGLGAIAFEGDYSGGWLDILLQGKYGRAFATPAELGEQLNQLAYNGPDLKELQHQGRERARMFDQLTYENRMEEIHGRAIGTNSL